MLQAFKNWFSAQTHYILFIVIFSVLTPSSLLAGYEEGLKAYVRQDYSQALQVWSNPDLERDPEALFALGVMYIRGVGVEQDQKKGADLYLRSATLGFASAQFNLGLAYFAGRGLEQSFARAGFWWLKAAKQEHAVAQYNLAALLWGGQGMTQDQSRAMHWFRKAKENGSSDASNFLLTLFAPMYKELNEENLRVARQDGNRSIPLIDEFGMYKLGLQAVQKEQFQQAFGYWEPLATDGHVDSQYQIARLLESGKGVQKSFDKALDWYQRAAQKGQGDAQYRLGLYYMNESEEKNEALGFYWMQSAADNNSQPAKEFINANR
ncbi:MAG: sel1 repeat family protein [Acidiferrobacterales bacterium]|nr:sel1 repeat family protein [Acidiferrobacterales bacterium]